MKPRTLLSLLNSGQVPLLIALERLIKPVYRAAFISAAATSGVLRMLADGPKPFDTIVERLELGADATDPLRGWLDLGVRLGELSKDADGYSLKSWWAKKLADPANDVTAAALEEVIRFHYPIVSGAPQMLKAGKRLTLADQDGDLIARATRILQGFVQEAVEMVVPASGAVRLLEVGCGSGVHVRHAATINQDLTAVAIDLQPEVADEAAKNIREWGLADRIQVLAGDVRSAEIPGKFDLLTLHNLIYYFPVDQRVALLEQLRAFLKPGGKLLLTTGCPGGNLGLDVISLWFAASDLGGRLPTPEEMCAQMKAAGFADARATNLMPGGSFYAFVGTHEAA